MSANLHRVVFAGEGLTPCIAELIELFLGGRVEGCGDIGLDGAAVD
jgi:hypothetical protein